MYITQSRGYLKEQGALFLSCHIWHWARKRLRSCQRPPFDLGGSTRDFIGVKINLWRANKK